MTIEACPRSLLREIFPERPSDSEILDSIMLGGTRVTLQEALNKALDTLPLTRGKNDSGPWQRWKTVLEYSYGFNRPKLAPHAIGVSCRIDKRFIPQIRREALQELRENKKVIQLLSAFFVPIPT